MWRFLWLNVKVWSAELSLIQGRWRLSIISNSVKAQVYKYTLLCVSACFPEPCGDFKWSAVAWKLSPWCVIKAHSTWCWQCVEGKPGLKGKCWGPQEPQHTSDYSTIILPRLSCTWKGKQKKPFHSGHQHAQSQCQLCGLAANQLCFSALLIIFTFCSTVEQVPTWKYNCQRLWLQYLEAYRCFSCGLPLPVYSCSVQLSFAGAHMIWW